MKRVCLLSPAKRASEAMGNWVETAGFGGWVSATAILASGGHKYIAAHNSAKPGNTR
jgi:hypothetical protein